jgi:HSP20 family protein
MNSLIRRNNDVSYDPFMDFINMESFFPTFSGSKSFPSVNISEDDKNYCVDVVAPGFNKDDFKINVENDMLTISAEAKSEWSDNDEDDQQNYNEGNEKQQKEKTSQSANKTSQSGSKNESKSTSGNGNGHAEHNRQYSRREYSYSSFTRTFRLPENTNDDSISANYKNGILKLMIPKSKQEEKATKQITVS